MQLHCMLGWALPGVLVTFLAPPATAANERDEPAPKRVVLALRFGYGMPFGDAQGSVPLDELFSSMLPFGIEAGYRVSDRVVLGAFFQYAFLGVGEREALLCPGLECSANDLRIGVQAHFHFRPGRRVRPWAGLGSGYEIATVSADQELTYAFKGIEFANLQGGADFELSPGLAVGPFATLSIAQYSVSVFASDQPTFTTEIDDASTHYWFVAGARAAFSL